MKYLKTYKLFESYGENNFIIDDNIIEQWFNDEFEYDEDTYKYMQNITDFAGDYMDIIKNDEINFGTIENYDEEDIKKYLIKEIKLDEEDINDLSKYELIELVPDIKKFIEYMWDELYGGLNTYEYLNAMGYADEDMYDVIENFIDLNKLEEYLKKNEDFSYKKDMFFDELLSNIELQKKIVKYNNFNAVVLLDFLIKRLSKIDNDYINSYEYQKIYIEETLNIVFDETPNKSDYIDEMISIFKKLDKNEIKINIQIKYDYYDEYKKYKINKQMKKFNI